MVLNEEKRKRLAELLARCQTTPTGAGGSTPAGPPLVATSAQGLPGLAPDDKQKRVVVAVDSEDEKIDECLVFKRPRVGVATTSLSGTDGHAPSYRDNPPSASSPRELLALEGGGESAPEGDQVPPAPKLIRRGGIHDEVLDLLRPQDRLVSERGSQLNVPPDLHLVASEPIQASSVGP